MRRIGLAVALATLLTVCAAGAQQGGEPTPAMLTIDTRVALLEDRVTVLQGNYASLSTVPAQLARIETQITQLSDRSKGNSGALQEVALSAFAAFASGIAVWAFGVKRKG